MYIYTYSINGLAGLGLSTERLRRFSLVLGKGVCLWSLAPSPKPHPFVKGL